MAAEKKFDPIPFSDEDLVDASTETIGGHPSQKSLFAQAELTKRLMVSIKSMDKTTSNYSEKILLLSIVLLIVAFAQLVVSL